MPPEPVVVASVLRAPPDEVWRAVTSLAGVNDELRPWLRMTVPGGREPSLDAAPLGERWFRSWLLLGGLVPFDFDDLRLERLDPGRGFHERSRMLSAPVWEHTRTLEPAADGGTVLTDRVAFVPRVQAAGRLQRRVVAALFGHRHRRLRRRFG